MRGRKKHYCSSLRSGHARWGSFELLNWLASCHSCPTLANLLLPLLFGDARALDDHHKLRLPAGAADTKATSRGLCYYDVTPANRDRAWPETRKMRLHSVRH